MNRLRWLGAAVIVVAVGAGMLWLLWPQPRPPIVAEATAGPYLVRLKDDPPKVGVSQLTIEIWAAQAKPRPRIRCGSNHACRRWAWPHPPSMPCP